MSTVAIICEYNPFHSGHEYQINEIRRQFGTDTSIIALMSGNFTQRGEMAIMDKTLRAKSAVDAGVNLCLELPFPYSMASAEIFAGAAVEILNGIGVVDYLSFGSESGDIALLERTADILVSKEYEDTLAALIEKSEDKGDGYPKLCERAIRALLGDDVECPAFTPNNILALEYIKALKGTRSSIKPHTIKRLGAGFGEENLVCEEHQSASAIRTALKAGDHSALEYVPKSTNICISEAMNNGAAPCDENALSAAVISFFRLSSPTAPTEIHDVGGGLYNRLRTKSFEANTITDLVRLTDTKKYTTARIRRAVWYSYFGVTSSEIKESPAYTSLLATDAIGRAELKRIKRTSGFPVITKPSAISDLAEAARAQKERSDRADAVFQLTKPIPPSGSFALITTPYVKHSD